MKVKLQFDFCPKCKYFKSCYSTDGNPHYLSEECLRDYEDGIYDDYEVTDSIREKNFTEQISGLNEKADELLKQLNPRTANNKNLFLLATSKGLEKSNKESEYEFRDRVYKLYQQI